MPQLTNKNGGAACRAFAFRALKPIKILVRQKKDKKFIQNIKLKAQ